jgi:hypothetical protein
MATRARANILTQIEIDNLIEELKSERRGIHMSKTKEEKLEKLMGLSLALLREQEILEAGLRKQKRLKIIRMITGVVIGLTVTILIIRL